MSKAPSLRCALAAPVQCGDRAGERVRQQRFLDEPGAGLIDLAPQLARRVAGNYDRRAIDAHFAQSPKQAQSVDAGQAIVEHEAVGGPRARIAERSLSARKGLNPKAGYPQREGQRRANRRIVVDHGHQEGVSHCGPLPSLGYTQPGDMRSTRGR